MSIIGKNIKKIRSVKKLNQQAFADLFDLKRSNVGAYEEGRADPKIKTLSDITNYFGISMETFISKELTVNDLYRFDLFREDLAGEAKHNLNPSRETEEIIAIPFVSGNLKNDYLDRHEGSFSVSQLPSLYIPMIRNRKYRAFEVLDHYMMSSTGGIMEGDIFIGLDLQKENPQLEVGKVYLFELEDRYIIRHVVSRSISQLTLGGDSPDAYSETINLKEISKFWLMSKLITKNIRYGHLIDKQIRDLQEEVRMLKSKI